MATKELKTVKYLVIGGGIAGVTCAETLSHLCPDEPILLLTASPLIKAVTNFRMVSKVLEEFDVEERPMGQLHTDSPNVQVEQAFVSKLDGAKHIVVTDEGNSYKYGKLCICTGGSPKVIAEKNPFVLGIRDTETVKEFQRKLKGARRVVIVGNGGIATELVYEIEGCEIIWAVKDASITKTFVDAGAAKFFLPQLNAEKVSAEGPSKRLKYELEHGTAGGCSTGMKPLGSALGPDWASGLDMHGQGHHSHQVRIEYQVEVTEVMSREEVKKVGPIQEAFPFSKEQDWPVYLKLTNGKIYGCDFIVSATGVTPNTAPFVKDNDFEVAEDGGLLVDSEMRTNLSDLYAAGDVCTVGWDTAKHWMQMRLWSQARQMGHYAAKCMVNHDQNQQPLLDFCFELFAHVTRFFNYKVVLLGKFNAQGLGNNYELLVRVSEKKEYVKVVMQNGKMQGAVLIGDTDLEETFENLILNETDLTEYGEDLLDPNIDIEDYFD